MFVTLDSLYLNGTSNQSIIHRLSWQVTILKHSIAGLAYAEQPVLAWPLKVSNWKDESLLDEGEDIQEGRGTCLCILARSGSCDNEDDEAVGFLPCFAFNFFGLGT